MKTEMRHIERKTVTIWTPWGAQTLDREETSRSRFRKKLQSRRQREDRKARTARENVGRT
ncbi:MAG: hypothetical protein MEQ84_03145 [Mesorhizobium sp.]|nr:hypothetical protein [Mesorhizobium sp.]